MFNWLANLFTKPTMTRAERRATRLLRARYDAAATNHDNRRIKREFIIWAKSVNLAEKLRTMRIAGWRYPVILDLAGLSIPAQSRPIRFSHDASASVGHTDSIGIDGGQLVATGVISRDTPPAREVVASSKNGFPWQTSVGASVDEFEFVKQKQTVMVNGREYNGPINVVRKSTLSEISFVDLGADTHTSATVAAAAGESDSQLNEEQTTMSTENSTDAVGVVHQDGDNGRPDIVNQPAPAMSNPVEDMRAQAAAETERITRIRRLCGDRHPEIEAMFDGPTLDVATERFRGGIGLQELLLEAAWANGYTGRNFRDSRAVLRFAFNPTLEAGFSTVDIGGILSNVANKFLLDGFFSVEGTWRNITAVRNVSDFKTVTSYWLAGKDQYEQVAPGGELKHGSLGEEKYENKADTYGLVLSSDRRDIINDDLDAITTVPGKLGRGSGLKINDVFWSTFLANSSFFTAGNKNYITGATTALSIDGLTEGEVTFMDQVDGDGKPIGIMPATAIASIVY